ncbi:5-carboxymethyl-2-hydroxymuconate semialdehyde dehydrogenase [Nymphon striatum]|nr:5-carboxymethyl-2-hydroxymuconate semialdehyde dehydrogenase [Nymphon striatum]
MLQAAAAYSKPPRPLTKSHICNVAHGTSADIDAAAKAAKAAKFLIRVAEGIEARAEEIALCECWDTGQAWRFMSKAALRGAENFRYFADQPIGPVGVITPWNTPFMLSTWKIAPALAAGCTVVHKPAEIAEEAGLPPGVLNVVNGFGEDAGKALTEHKDIKAIAFRVHLELGGKNPVIVFDDADLDRALDAVIFMIYSINGERCTSSSRLLVQESIRAEFEAKLVARVNNIKVGHPLDPDTEIGPLISDEHFAKVTSYFDIAKQDGATTAAGGVTVGDAGYFVRPTLFTDATNQMRIAREEIFGPVLTSIPFATEEQALEIANDTDYGLTGYVWTNDLTRALRFTDQLEAGMIWVNSENVRHLPTPFGGVKSSGIGRDGGDWSFEFYMEQKHVGFATGQHKISRLGV